MIDITRFSQSQGPVCQWHPHPKQAAFQVVQPGSHCRMQALVFELTHSCLAEAARCAPTYACPYLHILQVAGVILEPVVGKRGFIVPTRNVPEAQSPPCPISPLFPCLQIAGVILEPVVGNSGFIVPTQEFLEGLREITKAEGTLLCFDEVRGGISFRGPRAQAVLRVEAGRSRAFCDTPRLMGRFCTLRSVKEGIRF